MQAMQQAMPLLPIKPLDGAAGYRRWKESVLLRLRTLGLTYVLSDDPPTSADDEGASPAAKKWRNDDALCRAHILNTLSDRTFDVHFRRATAKDLWDALAETYDLETPLDLQAQFSRFKFVAGGGGCESVLEQLARFTCLAEATGMTRMMGDSAADAVMRGLVLDRLPVEYAASVSPCSKTRTMDELWGAVRGIESQRLQKHHDSNDTESDNTGSGDEPKAKPRRKGACYKCGVPGHIAKYCRTRK